MDKPRGRDKRAALRRLMAAAADLERCDPDPGGSVRCAALVAKAASAAAARDMTLGGTEARDLAGAVAEWCGSRASLKVAGATVAQVHAGRTGRN